MLDLITTKLMAPPPAAGVVERPRLLERLERGGSAKLTLVVAPAGAGKSTLLGSWLQRLPTAWLSLEPADDDPSRFLLYLVSALQQLDPSLGAGLPDWLARQGAAPAEAVITRLVNDAGRLKRDLVLVLDDYHALTDARIHGATEFLLEHLPPRLHLVIATRTIPPLSLSRLRVRGHLVEIGPDDLRFTLAETRALLNDRLGLALSPEAIARLEERTEGWAAGLRLAAISLAERADKEAFVSHFAGSHRLLVDYLMDEVLTRQPEEVRRFLERTSILGRFTADLCHTLTRHPASAAILKQLEATNLFVIPLDDERTWYRYHHLFAEFLQHRLREREAARLPELHRLASAWLERAGWLEEAVEHAFLAQDPERAARLVERVAFRLGIRWNNALLLRYTERLPRALLPAHPRLCIYYSLALINTGQVGALAALLPLVEASAAHAEQPRIVTACVVYLRGYQRLWRLDFAGAVTHCQEALALLDAGEPSPSDEERWLCVAATNLIAYSFFHSDPRRADAVYPAARHLSQALEHFVGTINGFARHGRVKHRLGQLYGALEVFQQGLDTAETWEAREGGVVNAGELHLNLAQLLYEWQRLDEAQTHLEQATALNELSRFPPVLARELETRFLLDEARGEAEAARARLGALDHMVHQAHPDNLFYRELFGVMAMEMRLRLARDDPHPRLGEIAAWVAARGLSAHDAFAYPQEGGYRVLARLLVAQGDWLEALALLERLARAAAADGRLDDHLRYLLWQALAHQGAAQEELAQTALRRALRLAEPEGYVRSFVDLGPAMHALLRNAARRGVSESPYISKLLAAFPAHSAPAQPSAEPAGGPTFSERERAVLRLLAVGHSHKQVAKALGLSPNTVRWYMRGLYAKLQASNRTEAVNRARDAGLL